LKARLDIELPKSFVDLLRFQNFFVATQSHAILVQSTHSTKALVIAAMIEC